MKQFIFLFSILISLYSSVLLADTNDLKKLQTLIDQQHYTQAYNLAYQLGDTESGNPEFDFLYGTAALYSKHYEEATFAFERVLIVQPANHRARLEYARALYLLKEYDSAEAEFDTVLATNPPPNVEQNIKRFLRIIEVSKVLPKTQTSVYARTSGGYDSNVNSATQEELIDIPELGLIQLTDESIQQSSPFFELDAGFNVTKPLTSKFTTFLGVDASTRYNTDATDFNTDLGVIQTGLTYQKNDFAIRIPITLQQLQLDGSAFFRATTVTPELIKIIDTNNRFSVFGQLENQNYPEQPSQNANQVLFGGSWAHLFFGNKLLSLVQLYVGDTDVTDNSAEFNSRTFEGVQFIGQLALSNNHLLYASLGGKYSHYGAVNPLLNPDQVRHDILYSAIVGWDWNFAKNWTLQTKYIYYNNDSAPTGATADLFSYNRHMASMGIEYHFATES